MSIGSIAALIAAVAFVVLVIAVVVLVVKLGRAADATTAAARQLQQAVPGTLEGVNQALDGVNTAMDGVNRSLGGVDRQLQKSEQVTDHVVEASSHLAAISSLLVATLGGPLIRVSSLSYGVRHAIAKRTRSGYAEHVAAELAWQQKLADEQAAEQARQRVQQALDGHSARTAAGRRSALGARVVRREPAAGLQVSGLAGTAASSAQAAQRIGTTIRFLAARRSRLRQQQRTAGRL